MVVVQKKRTMPDNKKVFKEVTTKEVTVPALLGGATDKKNDSKAKKRLINIAKQNKRFKDNKSFQAARDKELKAYREAVASGIKEGLSETSKEKGNILSKVKKITSKTMKKDAAFKLRSGNKPSIAKFMGVNKSPMRDEFGRDLGTETKGAKRIKKGIKDKSNKELDDIFYRNLPAFERSRLKKGYKYREKMPDFMKNIAEMADSSRAAAQILYERGELGGKK